MMLIVNKLKQIFKDNRKQYMLFGIALSVFFILVLLLNRLYPLYADDWGYIYSGNSFSEAFDHMCRQLCSQYFTWGGRTVVHLIAHLLSWSGLEFSNLINSLTFVFYLYIIYRISNKGNSINVLLFLFIGLYLWLIIPAFNSTVLWLVGAANYMWGALIVILFLSAYYFYYVGSKERKGWLYVVFFFFAGVVSGWTNENLFIAQVFFIASLFLLFKREGTSLPAWAIAGFIGVCIGGLFMIAAPGNYLRSEVVKKVLGLTDKSAIELIAYRVLKVGYRYVVYVLPCVIVYIIVFYFYIKQNGNNKRKVLTGSLLFFISGNIACFTMIASYIFPPRAIFGIITFIVIATGILFANRNMETLKMKRIRIIVLIVLFVSFIINYIFDYKNITYLSGEFSKREVLLNQQKQSGNSYIIFEGEIVMPPRYNFEDLSDDPSHWLNKGYSKYHGVDSVKVLR